MDRRNFTLLLAALLTGCTSVGFRGSTLEVLVVEPVPVKISPTPIVETNLLGFGAVSDPLTEAHDQRDELIADHYDDPGDGEYWQYMAAWSFVEDQETYRAIQSELEAVSRWDERPHPIPHGWYITYRDDVYVLRLVEAE